MISWSEMGVCTTLGEPAFLSPPFGRPMIRAATLVIKAVDATLGTPVVEQQQCHRDGLEFGRHPLQLRVIESETP